MTEPEIVVRPDPGSVAAEAAERIAATVAAAVEARGRAHWATTGGSTPAAIYRLLAAAPLRDRVPWDRIELWFGDDRFVPGDDPLSNAGLARDGLLTAVPIPSHQVHPIPTDDCLAAGETPEQCAARYAAQLREAGIDVVDGWPAFDLVFVGIGPDGHLLSVFPGSSTFDRNDWALGVPAPDHVEPHVPRVTLNPRILDVARSLLVVAHGAGKADVLGEVLAGPRDERRLPAQLARRAGATWILDAAAAARVAGDGAARRRTIRSADGTRIALFSSGDPAAPPLLLVHGATADHTTFRAVEPVLARRFAVHAMDRRGRGASGDGPTYAVEREFEDVAAVADALAVETGRAVDVIGHSYGGRCALGAALRTDRIRRLVVYEGAPEPPEARYDPPGFRSAFDALLAAGDHDGALELFFRRIVGMDDVQVDAYRASPTWPARVAAAATIPRELDAEASPAAGLEVVGAVRCPVLQVLGGESLPTFRLATEALDARLVDSRIVVIDGAAHAAHHTHPEAFVAAVESFLA